MRHEIYPDHPAVPRGLSCWSAGAASERTLEVNAERRTRGLPVCSRAPMGWKLIGIRAKASGTKTSSLEFAVDDQERRLVEAIYAKRQDGTSIERIAIWLITQREYPNKRKLDNYKAVEWAIAAKELGFPQRNDGKRVVQEWRRASRGIPRHRPSPRV